MLKIKMGVNGLEIQVTSQPVENLIHQVVKLVEAKTRMLELEYLKGGGKEQITQKKEWKMIDGIHAYKEPEPFIIKLKPDPLDKKYSEIVKDLAREEEIETMNKYIGSVETREKEKDAVEEVVKMKCEYCDSYDMSIRMANEFAEPVVVCGACNKTIPYNITKRTKKSGMKVYTPSEGLKKLFGDTEE